ncbi:porin PorA family protein [Nocardioides lijunqiniae]|uniref:porin PorA family protein n=1 Tax=Nocardioides lijunqiniae TaxID=2760832 RepID=UPI00187806E2
MRKNLGAILLALSGFLLVVGLLALVWAPGQVKKLPLDVNSVTHLSGTVSKLGSPESPVKVESISKVDSDASDDEIAVWVNTSCVVIDVDDAPNCVDGTDERLVSASTDVFATDRVSAEAVKEFEGLPDDATTHVGLINKWPFESEKKDYEYWDGTADAAVPAVYDRTDTLEGVDLYVYKIDVKDADIEVAEGVAGTYDNSMEIWVEPTTGAILQQSQDQQRYLESGSKVLDLKIKFTDDQVKESASDAKDNVSKINLITTTIPIVALSAGVIALVAAILLILGNRRSGGAQGRRGSGTV